MGYKVPYAATSEFDDRWKRSIHPSIDVTFCIHNSRNNKIRKGNLAKRGHRDLVIFILLSKDHATIRRLTSRWRQVAFIAIDGSSWLIHRECQWRRTIYQYIDISNAIEKTTPVTRWPKNQRFISKSPRWILMKLIRELVVRFEEIDRDPTEIEDLVKLIRESDDSQKCP